MEQVFDSIVSYGQFLLVLLAVALVSGCASSDPVVAPLSDDAYTSSWLVVPVDASSSDSDIADAERAVTYDKMMEEIRTSLDGYGQSYTVYTGSPDVDAGISADSLYEQVPDHEQRDVEDERQIDVDVLRAISEEANVRYLFVVHPNLEVNVDRPALGIGIGIPIGGGASVGVSVPLIPLGSKKVPVTAATLWGIGASPGEADSTMDLRPLWSGLRSAESGRDNAFLTPEEAVVYGLRSMILEMKTGRPINPHAFTLEADNNVIVYRHDEPTVRGNSFKVDGTDVVVKQEDGGQMCVPFHTVSSIRSPKQNRKIF